METLKEKTAKGLFWGGLSNGLQQLIGLVFGIFLARLLSQDDYGMVGMLTIFSAVAAALQEGGFISALNQKKEATQRDYNAVFWFSTMLSICMYVILFFCAPLIARFYDEPELVPLSRYVFLGFVITSFGIAPRAWLFRNLRTKEAAITMFTALAVSNFVGVLMALAGMAYWGLATQSLVYITLFMALNFYFSRWKPNLHIDFQPIREMIGFSSRLVITGLFNILNANLFTVIFGRLYTKTDVGNYTQASKWTNMGTAMITNMLNGIAQPVFARIDDNPQRQLQVFRKLMRFTAFVSFPAMLGLCLVSEELIIITVTEKWLPSVPLMQWLCIGGAFAPVAALLYNLLISRGHSNTYMWSTIGQSLTQLAAVCAVVPWGMMWMLRVFVVINILWVLVWWYLVRKEIHLQLSSLVHDLAPYLLLTAALITLSWYLTQDLSNVYLRLAAKIAITAIPYCLTLWLSGSVIFKESLRFLLKKQID